MKIKFAIIFFILLSGWYILSIAFILFGNKANLGLIFGSIGFFISMIGTFCFYMTLNNTNLWLSQKELAEKIDKYNKAAKSYKKSEDKLIKYSLDCFNLKNNKNV